MTDDAAAEKAIAELNGATVEGRQIKVNVARPKEERPARQPRQQRPSYSNNSW